MQISGTGSLSNATVAAVGSVIFTGRSKFRSYADGGMECVTNSGLAYSNFIAKLTTDTAYTAGAPVATGYLVLYDSAGVAYKVPAVAA